MTTISIARLAEKFPFLRQVGVAVQQELATQGHIQRLSIGTTIFWEGDACTALALILTGTVRVFKVGETGREITLYRIEAHESCILTASCILSQTYFPAIAQAETDVEALLIPASTLQDWVARDAAWRNYIMGLLAHRLAGVIATVEEVAFRRVDARIAEFLLTRTGGGTEAKPEWDAAGGHWVVTTHQEIAYELGTAREVVSRILKDLERTGVIQLGRGTITVLDRAALQLTAGLG